MKNTIKFIASQAINTPVNIVIVTILGFSMGFAAAAKDSLAEVTVKDAWVRTSVPGQKASGAFMTLTSKVDVQLVGASSPVAGIAEVHEMKMNGDVMQMRAAPSVDLPAGKAVALRPGGYHIMLLDLKTALPKDSTVPLTLLFKDAKGVQSKIELTVPVATAAPGAKAGAAMDMHQH